MYSRFLFLVFLLSSNTLAAQEISLDYYFPEVAFEKDIPSPEQVLGFQIGAWHMSHDQLVRYMIELAESSDRVQWQEYGRTYEDRPLLLLTISSKKNLDRLEDIREKHLRNADPDVGPVDMSKEPVIVYQGFSIHGNEASGSNASALLAYYLAAGKGREIEKLLDGTVILLDPCFNPDGFQRFSTWANMHKSARSNADPQSREFNEVWPGGRTNHYWFDLNRDWLLAQHPESQGRLQLFHQWKPNVLTDHHEMGTNASFFFQPGVPQRTNPLTPAENQDLTGKLGRFHASAMDEIGSLYYTQESYDDFYYGKGSTYPDINGSVGILFEQASSRGHVQESDNGLLRFPFTIRNQLTAARSTLKGAQTLRTELLSYQHRFYQDAKQEAAADRQKAYMFGDLHDQSKLQKFVELLERHQVNVYELKTSSQVDGKTYEPGKAFVVPLGQDQYRLIRTIFESTTTFQDSLFYDVSAWTLPLAFNLDYTVLDRSNFSPAMIGPLCSASSWKAIIQPEYSEYAYLLEWDDYQAPQALNQLLESGLRVKVATEPFQTTARSFDRGTLMIQVANQGMDPEVLYAYIQQISRENNIRFYDADTGLTPVGIDFGSNQFETLRLPSVLLIGGSSSSAYEVGELWYLLEERFGIPASIVEADRIHRIDLDRYNVILMADGSYSAIEANGIKKIKDWVRSGGTLWCQRGAVNWAINNQLSGAKMKVEKEGDPVETWKSYSGLSANKGSFVIGGAILQTEVDRSHPLLFGIKGSTLPVFRRGTIFLDATENPYASPIRYSDNPVYSGYVHRSQVELLRESPALVVSGIGRGRVICVSDNPNFRAYWYGTQKITANAIFFGNLISGQAIETIKGD
ncbi:MAG: zinc carboxypeptidase [Saprospiraceae bacterium]|nr:zinc carboxypeptidase [Saprospiraceae bacterium]